MFIGKKRWTGKERKCKAIGVGFLKLFIEKYKARKPRHRRRQ